jgi:hypothetical protein
MSVPDLQTEATELQSWKDEHRLALGSVETCEYCMYVQNTAPKVKEGGAYNYHFALKGQCNIIELYTLK